MTKITDAGAQTGQDTVAETTAPETPPLDQDPVEGTGSAKAEKEIGGPPGPEPTRFGDWEKKGRCIDF